jgi:carboxymethylenebutenolidase
MRLSVNMQSATLRTQEGLNFNSHRANAESEAPIRILLLPEMFGLTPAMCEAAEAFAVAGYTTLVPNLFWRDRAHPGVMAYEGAERQTAFERLQALDLDAAVEDIELAAKELSAASGREKPVVAVGHCIGGRLAVLALPRTRLRGAVSYYGLGISAQGEALAHLVKPAQSHYGLADEHVPPAEVQAVQALAKGNPSISIFCYENAGHSFCNPYRPMYDRTAAALVRQRTLAFFAEIEKSGEMSTGVVRD